MSRISYSNKKKEEASRVNVYQKIKNVISKQFKLKKIQLSPSFIHIYIENKFFQNKK